MNYINIQEKRHIPEPTPTVVQDAPRNTSPTIITIIKDSAEPTPTPEDSGILSPTPTPSSGVCIKEIGPIVISTPDEGAFVTSNPLQITVDYDQGDYCSAVWSYRINEGTWSEYGDNDIVVYNLASGRITLDLRVKSIASAATKTLKRTFTYTNTSATATPPITLSPTPII
ncbi:hypothetical protein KBD81_01095 [Candidatus Woesebacteria bacterium]|nr:hypothetical protein [Candidatus Woesebacteria bacterium]